MRHPIPRSISMWLRASLDTANTSTPSTTRSASAVTMSPWHSGATELREEISGAVMAGLTRLSTGDGFPNVVVTGIAMTTSVATDADGTWKALLDGRSGIRKLEDPFVEQYSLPVRMGGPLLWG